MLVGAAAEQPRRGQASKVPFRGHRGGDTGELEPVDGGSSGGSSGGQVNGRGEVDPEELRYAPQAPRRGRWARGLAALVVIAVVAVTVGIFAYRWSQRQYFVAADHKKVAIYRGVQADIPGLTMNRVAEGTNVTVAALPDYPAQQVRSGISADSLAAAREIVVRLTGLARVCPTATAANSVSVSVSVRLRGVRHRAHPPAQRRPQRRLRPRPAARCPRRRHPSLRPPALVDRPARAPVRRRAPLPARPLTPPQCIEASS
jgi:hypothetical protein